MVEFLDGLTEDKIYGYKTYSQYELEEHEFRTEGKVAYMDTAKYAHQAANLR